jgi:hypothetical protein
MPEASDEIAADRRSSRGADARFVLPVNPRRVLVLDEPTWTDALEIAEVKVVAPGDPAIPDVVISHASAADRALAVGADTVLFTGPVRSARLRRAGYHTTRLLMRDGHIGPRLLVPIGRSGLPRVALVDRSVGLRAARRARNALLATAVQIGFAPPGATMTLGSRSPGPPWVIGGALDAGEIRGRRLRWCLELGDGDDLQRGAFHVGQGRGAAHWIVKFARTRGHDGPFENDERGLALITSLGPTLARRAPRLVRRRAVEELPVSVETAAPGRSVQSLLHARGATRRNRRLIDDVAAWISELGVRSAQPSATLAAERARLERDILPAWLDSGAPGDLLARVPAVPGVLAHHDLGSWNIVANRSTWTVLDWESARAPSFPLWDMIYFLSGALVALDGPPDGDELQPVLALLRGEHRESETLFGWVRHTASALSIPPEAIGPIATLGWLHHGRSHAVRHQRLDEEGLGRGRVLSTLERVAPAWLADSVLGPAWSALR